MDTTVTTSPQWGHAQDPKLVSRKKALVFLPLHINTSPEHSSQPWALLEHRAQPFPFPSIHPSAGGKQSRTAGPPSPHLSASSHQTKFPVCQALFLIEKLFSAKSCIRCQETSSAPSLGWIELLQNDSFKPCPAVFHFLTRIIHSSTAAITSTGLPTTRASPAWRGWEMGDVLRQEITQIPIEFGSGFARDERIWRCR